MGGGVIKKTKQTSAHRTEKKITLAFGLGCFRFTVFWTCLIREVFLKSYKIFRDKSVVNRRMMVHKKICCV